MLRTAVLPFLLLLVPVAAEAQEAPRKQCAGQACVELIDLTPKFLAFWDAAKAAPPADAEARFALWKQRYGFAAVPPGPRGEALARQLLAGAWDRYDAALPRIRSAAATWQPAPLDSLAAVVRVLDYSGAVDVRATLFVGGFEANAFAFSMGGTYYVHFPVESDDDHALAQAHEFAHAVHGRAAGLGGGWERSIAQTLLQEGLAMHVAREVAPGRPVSAYVSHAPGWWDSVQPRKAAVLADIRPVLEAKDGATVWKYTIGEGGAGVRREAYAAGWWVIEQLRANGMTLPQIARIPESDMARVSREAIDALLSR
ncbi:MAG: hypothetical protein J7500_09750 [Sphingomonas sp.]|uniref:hypothetical protein n=1 Tax=Sphingomonas sp. TaxID=28214 RepID=UPI001B21D566|nr:hypothetical protein [Sphingomonas sp.]MBO9622982.1 hypothetical protein [Sphingomonas sp.]